MGGSMGTLSPQAVRAPAQGCPCRWLQLSQVPKSLCFPPGGQQWAASMLSSPHSRWGDTSPSLAQWAHPCSSIPQVTQSTSPALVPNVASPHSSLLQAVMELPGLILGEHRRLTVLSSFWCLASRCLWRAVANLASAFAQHSRGIPAWCWQTDPTTKQLMFYISALHVWGSPKTPHHCSKQATTRSPFKASGSSCVNWGTEPGSPASQQTGQSLPQIPLEQNLVLPNCGGPDQTCALLHQCTTASLLLQVASKDFVGDTSQAISRVCYKDTAYTNDCSTKHSKMRAAVALEIFLNFLTMLLNDSSGYFFHRLFLYTLISFQKSFK